MKVRICDALLASALVVFVIVLSGEYAAAQSVVIASNVKGKVHILPATLVASPRSSTLRRVSTALLRRTREIRKIWSGQPRKPRGTT
jgi:hypothetical protein